MNDFKCQLISTSVTSALVGGQLHTSAVLDSVKEPSLPKGTISSLQKREHIFQNRFRIFLPDALKLVRRFLFVSLME
jgi:hypothetical protein